MHGPTGEADLPGYEVSLRPAMRNQIYPGLHRRISERGPLAVQMARITLVSREAVLMDLNRTGWTYLGTLDRMIPTNRPEAFFRSITETRMLDISSEGAGVYLSLASMRRRLQQPLLFVYYWIAGPPGRSAVSRKIAATSYTVSRRGFSVDQPGL